MMIIIIIMSGHQLGYPWAFLATLLYRPLLLPGLQGYNLQRAVVCGFKIKAHTFRHVCIDMDAYACSCSFQTMLKGFGLGGCICQKRYVISVVASVIVFAGYLLLLSFVSLKPFSFILSIDVLSTWFRLMVKKYGTNVSPCITTISK